MRRKPNPNRIKWSHNALAKRRRLMVERGIAAEQYWIKKYESHGH
jgi:hypothetical protein